MVLLEMKYENGAVGKSHVGRALKHPFAILVAPARARINSPRGFFVIVDCEFDRTRDSFLVGLIV
jgi:hypothetical protein